MQWHKTEGRHQNCVQAQVLYGPNSGNKVLIPRVKLVPSDTNLPFTLERNQLPLRLAYSMTIKAKLLDIFAKTCFYTWSAICSFFMSKSSL